MAVPSDKQHFAVQFTAPEASKWFHLIRVSTPEEAIDKFEYYKHRETNHSWRIVLKQNREDEGIVCWDLMGEEPGE